MKKTTSHFISLFIFLIILMSSCSTMYQVVETSSNGTRKDNIGYDHENSDIQITYDFWSEGGRMSFLIYNKLDSAIYIDWDKSHFIYNGISYEYWEDEEEENSFYSSISAISSRTSTNAFAQILGSGFVYGNSNTSQSGFGRRSTFVSSSKSKAKRIIHVPPKSSIYVSKFSIDGGPFFDCKFNLKSTSRRKINKKVFVESNSPLTFRNYLTYSTNESLKMSKSVDNSFYVSSASFMTKDRFFGKSINSNSCNVNGDKIPSNNYVLPYMNQYSFYFKVK